MNAKKILSNYKQIKAKYPDALLLFRSANHYIALNDDSKIVAHICGTQLTNTLTRFEYYKHDFDSIKSHINNDLNLHFYQVKTVGGYYSGFWIDIENDWLCIDSYKDRAIIQKEITQIKKFLIKCVMEYGMRVHYPGWVVGWEDVIENSIKKINEAIKEERQEVKKLPIFDKNDPLKHLRQ